MDQGRTERPKSRGLPHLSGAPRCRRVRRLRSVVTTRAGAGQARNSRGVMDDKSQGDFVPLTQGGLRPPYGNPLYMPRFGLVMYAESWPGEAGPTLPREQLER